MDSGPIEAFLNGLLSLFYGVIVLAIVLVVVVILVGIATGICCTMTSC